MSDATTDDAQLLEAIEGEGELISSLATKQLLKRPKTEVLHVMNIQHFEQLQETFLMHVNEDGSAGFDLHMFREVFSKVLGDNITFDQMTLLFMKIDANSDGSVDWDEFSTYMMAGNNTELEKLV
jgi:hypothetical protein